MCADPLFTIKYSYSAYVRTLYITITKTSMIHIYVAIGVVLETEKF